LQANPWPFTQAPHVLRRFLPRGVKLKADTMRYKMFPLVVWSLMVCAQAEGPATAHDNLKEAFLQMCDRACAELDKDIVPFEEKYRSAPDPQTHHTPFFEDAYVVRALCAAYDMTGKRRYWDSCRRWADRVSALQDRMIPKGAYYLNYFREPGKEQGDWFVADSGSVGAGILAVAVRAEGKDKERYLDSARAFAKLVLDNYAGKDGGITDGIWSAFDGEWWCSTATFGTFLLHLSAETGDLQYRTAGLRALDWLAHQDMRKAEHISFEESAPGVVFYCGEFFATALHFLEAGECKDALPQIETALQWMAENQKGRGAATRWNYLKEATYMSGMPYIMYLLARALPQRQELNAAADQELNYVVALLSDPETPNLTHLTTWELTCWAMLSLAEKLEPGTVLRTSKMASRQHNAEMVRE
jgi:hypothetical protein